MLAPDVKAPKGQHFACKGWDFGATQALPADLSDVLPVRPELPRQLTVPCRDLSLCRGPCQSPAGGPLCITSKQALHRLPAHQLPEHSNHTVGSGVLALDGHLTCISPSRTCENGLGTPFLHHGWPRFSGVSDPHGSQRHFADLTLFNLFPQHAITDLHCND